MLSSPSVTILNVEDSAITRAATSALLQQAGYHVIEAGSGTEALQLAVSQRPHLILLDVELPDLNGYEVCRRLKSDSLTKLIPILQISGSLVDGGDKVRGLDSGADAYLLKPVEAAEMKATIRALLRLRDAEESVFQTEERLRLALDAAVLGTWDWKAETNYSIWGGHHIELFGLPPDTPGLSGAEFLAMVHPADRQLMKNMMRPSGANENRYTMEFRIIRPDGKVRWMRDQGQIYRDERGRTVRIVGVVQDITERKHSEAEHERLLQRERTARAEAEAATHAKDEFLAVVSHELRAPLNAMLGWAKILKSGKYKPDIFEHAIDVIERSARSQQQLIEDLLDSARIISGKMRLEMLPADLTVVIKDALDIMRPAAEAKGIKLDAVFLAEADVITGDPQRLQQVVWNLLSNAVKFTPVGGKVTVKLERVDPYLQLTVSDTGKGINRDYLPYVFDRFNQADNSNTRRHSGLGLGLALVRHLVELHGGTVSVDSPGEGLGTVFTINLPLRAVRAQSTEVELPDAHSKSGGLIQTLLEGLQILVVDDEADARDLVTLILEQQGAQVVVAASVEEALAVLQQAGMRPDIIVSDIGMPGENGYALMRRIRSLSAAEGGRIPAVALTAYGRSKDRIAALAAGFQMHVPKPVEPTELIMVIAGLTGRAAKGMNGGSP